MNEAQLRDLGQSLLSMAGSMLVGVLIFVFSIIVAGVFLVSADGGYRVARTFGRTLSDELTTIHCSFAGLNARNLYGLQASIGQIAPIEKMNIFFNRQGVFS